MTESSPLRPSFAGPLFLSFAAILLISALAVLPFWVGKPVEDGLQGIAQFIGRFHPVVLHLPIGMLVWVLILETGNLFSRKPGRPSSRMPMLFTAISAVTAALLGFVLYQSTPDYDAELVERHLYGGLFFACATVATFAFKSWVDTLDGRGAWLYRILLLGCAGVMGFTSHDGASLTHGKGYLTDHAPDPLRKLLGLPERKPVESAPAADINERIVYSQIIVPILEQKCYSCHNADKQRGKFRMDDYELLLAGGKEGDGIIPGNAAGSNVIVRIELPDDDDEHMPPEGKKDLDPHELVLLKWWIDQGAPMEAKLMELAATDEVRDAIANLVPMAAPAPVEKPEADLSNELVNEIKRLQAEFPAALNYEFQGARTLTFTATGMREQFGDEQLAMLKPVLPAMSSLDLSHTSVTDEGVRLLAGATNLKSLRLAGTSLSDVSLETLSGLRNLESLNLYGTQVTGQGVMMLASLEGLGNLYLWQTQVDEDSLQKLRQKMPDCEILTGL